MLEALREIDHTIFHFINQGMANPVLDWLCVILRGKPFLATCYVIFSVIILVRYPSQFLKIAILGALTFLLTDQISSAVVKAFIHRIRPCNNPAINARLLLDACGAGFSFTSSHAANSFGMATFLIFVASHKLRNTFILGTWAALVCFSQVYVGVHFPADVVGGALLGILIGSATGFVFIKYATTLKMRTQ
ncbi:MAG: phospholipid phosphatase [Bacteroidota bacterium]|nr:phospholipid phosphatase [Bacteroidota bacterium]